MECLRLVSMPVGFQRAGHCPRGDAHVVPRAHGHVCQALPGPCPHPYPHTCPHIHTHIKKHGQRSGEVH